MTPRLETARLLLEPLRLEDAVQTQQLFPRWGIVRFLNARVPWPYPDDGAFTFYRDVVLPAVERGDEWHWTLRLRSSPEQLIGAVCLRRGEQDNRGFWLGLPWQGQGLMTEAVMVINNYWFDVVGLSVLRVPKAIDNTASRRISEKTGMRVIALQERAYVSGMLLSEVWELTAEEWRRQRALMRTAHQP